MGLLRRIAFGTGLIGATLSLIVYALCLSQYLARPLPQEADSPGSFGGVLHVLSVFAFVIAFLLFQHRLRNAPPAIRANSLKYLKQTGPAPLRYILIGTLVFAVANLIQNNLLLAALGIPVAGADACSYERMFAPHWILFFLAASYLSWPAPAGGADETSREHSKMRAALTSEMGNPMHSGVGNALDSDTRNAVRAHFSTDHRPSLMKRIFSGGFAFALGITAVLSIILGTFALIFEVYFYLFVALMFAVVTYVNYRYRKKQCWYHLLAISIDRTVRIRYFDGDTLLERQYARETVRADWKEEVIRGNSIFYLLIFAAEEAPLKARVQSRETTESSQSDGVRDSNGGAQMERLLLRQQVNAFWSYEKLDSVHGFLNA